MNTTLHTLIKLQAIDRVIIAVRHKIDEYPVMMQQLDKVLSNSVEKVAKLRLSIDEQERFRRSKEIDIEASAEQIKKYQGQLVQVKTNKEYTTLLLEIKSAKSKNTLVEDDVLELMEGIERAKKALSGALEEAEAVKTKIHQEKQRQEVEYAKLQEQLAEQERARQALTTSVEQNVLREYAKMLQLRNGIAVTAVQENGICNACRVALTPQMFAEVKAGDFLHRCPTCFRFLYWGEESSSQIDA